MNHVGMQKFCGLHRAYWILIGILSLVSVITENASMRGQGLIFVIKINS